MNYPFSVLTVSYSQLVQFSLETAHNSVRKAIADLCNVSPLRVIDIHVRNQREELILLGHPAQFFTFRTS